MSRRTLTAALVGTCAVTLLFTGLSPASAAPKLPGPATHHVFSADATSVGAHADPAGRAKAMEALAATNFPRANAYGAPTLWNEGDTGQGTSIATVVSFGDPNINAVMDTFDKDNGLPPVDVTQLQPAGPVPTCDSLKTSDPTTYTDCLGWRGEADLDVESMHEMAPSAHIIVTATPVDETEGMTGFPEMMTAIDYLRQHKLVNGIYLATYTAEADFSSPQEITQDLDPTFIRAAKAGISVVFASGDKGPTVPDLLNNNYPYRMPSWPGSDPNGISLGGTQFYGEPQGQPYPASPAARLVNPDSLWNSHDGYSSSAGLSTIYQRPSWQNGVKGITGSTMRAYPDITMHGTSGTSEAAPLFLGVLALAVEMNHGHNLGNIDSVLYRKLGPAGLTDGVQDVTTGNNALPDGIVPGFAAGPGYDIASGWGTVGDISTFVPALVEAVN
ncbi:MAG TPA: S53 family peptidase [Pseudonocardiaceae bacterium]|jgi:subtilase family serine protease|nr:S53 family peptidase [Pseudonocardiaceae bacterium]